MKFCTPLTLGLGNHKYMTLKLDMSKIYDRVKCVFLEEVMIKMSFHLVWVELIMNSIILVSCSLLIDG